MHFFELPWRQCSKLQGRGVVLCWAGVVAQSASPPQPYCDNEYAQRDDNFTIRRKLTIFYRSLPVVIPASSDYVLHPQFQLVRGNIFVALESLCRSCRFYQ